MKKLVIIALALSSSTVFAQLNLDFRAVGSSFQLDFNKGFVCKVSPAFSKAPTLGYGQDLTRAKFNAINNCIAETGNHRMHCESLACEAISFNSDKPSVGVSVVNGQIGVRFSVGSKYYCAADAAFGGGLFVAEAPTRIEAEVYAEKLCMEQTGNARMHCDVEACNAISGTIVGTNGVNIGGVDLGGLFSTNTADEIKKLESEIKVLEEKIANPNISEKSKKKLTEELSKKTEKLIELKAKQ